MLDVGRYIIKVDSLFLRLLVIDGICRDDK